MNIWGQKANPKLIGGHLYRLTRDGKDGNIYIYCPVPKTLYSLSDGVAWCTSRDFGGDKYLWEDVTDQYCLTKVN